MLKGKEDFSKNSGYFQSRSKDPRDLSSTGIPLPRGYKDSKIVKTEKNRMKLILQSQEQEATTDESEEKEERIAFQSPKGLPEYQEKSPEIERIERKVRIWRINEKRENFTRPRLVNLWQLLVK